MPFIEPNTNLYILNNVPLSTTYENTLYFDDVQTQTNTMRGYEKYHLTRNSYQRVNSGRMRVNVIADHLYDCNYLMFQNESFGTKWFYAFITSVEYVNNVTAEITYVLDVMQTWYFDYTLPRNFVVREHSKTDVIGENLVPEGLEQGDYIQRAEYIIGQYYTDPAHPYGCVVFMCTFNNDDDLTDFKGGMYNGVFCGINPIWFDVTSTSGYDDMMSFVDKVVQKNKWNGIVSCYMSPWSGDNMPSYGSKTETIDIPKNTVALDKEYVPRNNKLLTYPYNVLHISTDTTSTDYHYEYFNGDNCTFNINRFLVPQPTQTLTPTNYLVTGERGEESSQIRRDMRLTITDYPECAFNGDTYKIYRAQNATSIPVKCITSAATSAYNASAALFGSYTPGNESVTGTYGDGFVMNPQVVQNKGSISKQGLLSAGAIELGYFSQMANWWAQLKDIDSKPPQQNGSQTSPTDYAMGIKNFTARYLTIRKEYAEIIDDFFDRFGYAVHRVKEPNRKARALWTFVKTQGCQINGSMPADHEELICKIYDKGITFWTNPNMVNRYDQPNPPLGDDNDG